MHNSKFREFWIRHLISQVNISKSSSSTSTACTGLRKYSQKKILTRWTPPTEGSLKVNTDASFSESLGWFVSGVARDHGGHLVSAWACRKTELILPESSFEGELFGISCGLNMTRKLMEKDGYSEVFLENDSDDVVLAMNGEMNRVTSYPRFVQNMETFKTEIGAAKDDFTRLKSEFKITISGIKRKANRLADQIARFSRIRAERQSLRLKEHPLLTESAVIFDLQDLPFHVLQVMDIDKEQCRSNA